MTTIQHRRTTPAPICGCDGLTTIDVDYRGHRPVITIVCDTCGALGKSTSVPEIHTEVLYPLPDDPTKAAA